jgi:hypothetical protein
MGGVHFFYYFFNPSSGIDVRTPGMYNGGWVLLHLKKKIEKQKY